MELKEHLFTLEDAINCAISFSAAYKIGCSVYDGSAHPVFPNVCQPLACNLCEYLNTALCIPPLRSLKYQERGCLATLSSSGGWRLYSCPHGIRYFAVPVLTRGVPRAFLVGGPVILAADGDRALFDILKRNNVSVGLRNGMFDALSNIPFMTYGKIAEKARILESLAHCMSQPRGVYSLPSIAISRNFLAAGTQSADGIEDALYNAFLHHERPLANRLLLDCLSKIHATEHGNIVAMRRPVLVMLIRLTQLAFSCGADISVFAATSYASLQHILHIKSFRDISSLLIKIMNVFFDQFTILPGSKYSELAYPCIEYVLANYMRRVPLNEVSAKAFMSPPYFSRLFKRFMRCNYNTYVNHMRVEWFKLILLTHNGSVTDIANLIGFDDQSYFTKVFKTCNNGVTPAKYKSLLTSGKFYKHIDTSEQ